MKDQDTIAERVIYAVDRLGRGFDIGLQIGRPYQVESPYQEWVCEVALIGLVRPLPGIRGDDSWQAVLLAFHLVKNLLAVFVESDGGKLYLEKGGPEVTVDEAFGIPYKEPEEQATPEPPLSKEQQERCDSLTAEELLKIDDALIANSSNQWRKVARVVGGALADTCETIPRVPDIFYASRVRKLVEEGRLVSQGNLEYMRFSEVKLPESSID